MGNAKADAALYLLTGLLQHLDAERPGMLLDMIAGVEGDRAALPETLRTESMWRRFLTRQWNY